MKCKYEHDGDCCNSGATQYMCKCKQPCGTIVPIANGDRIRSMSDEELAQIISQAVTTGACNDLGIPSKKHCDSNCKVCILEWLQQGVE